MRRVEEKRIEGRERNNQRGRERKATENERQRREETRAEI